jgi:hypothetical protein
MERSNILIIGTLASGSSALVDMLKEYENINVLPLEFNIYRRPGFVSDQLSPNTCIDYPNIIDESIKFTSKKWKLLYKSSIWKLFFKSYFDNIRDKNWGILGKYKNSLISLRQIFLLKELSKNLKSEKSFEEKIQLSNEWINQIGDIYSWKYDFTLYNQALFPWCDINIWPMVFKPFKLICVLRDPKDQLAEMVRRDIVFSPFRNSQINYAQFNIVSIYGNDRKGRMKFVTDALKKRVEVIDQWMKALGPDKMLVINFEGLISNYDVYKSQIEIFLGLSKDRHKYKNKYFNPDVALKNSIGIFKDYLSEEEIEDLSDLQTWYNDKFMI